MARRKRKGSTSDAEEASSVPVGNRKRLPSPIPETSHPHKRLKSKKTASLVSTGVAEEEEATSSPMGELKRRPSTAPRTIRLRTRSKSQKTAGPVFPKDAEGSTGEATVPTHSAAEGSSSTGWLKSGPSTPPKPTRSRKRSRSWKATHPISPEPAEGRTGRAPVEGGEVLSPPAREVKRSLPENTPPPPSHRFDEFINKLREQASFMNELKQEYQIQQSTIAELKKKYQEQILINTEQMAINTKQIAINTKQISVNTKMAEDISKLKGEIAIIHQRLCERELVTGAFTALGIPGRMRRVDFLEFLRGRQKIVRDVFEKEMQRSFSEEDFEQLLEDLNPDEHNPTTILHRGNKMAHGYTIEQAKIYAKNESLISVLNLCSKRQPANSEIRDAAFATRDYLLMTYPDLEVPGQKKKGGKS